MASVLRIAKYAILAVGLAAGLAVAVVFLDFTYSTMYKQNHSIPILEYHNISSQPDEIMRWTVSTDEFRTQMAYLKENCNVIPLGTLIDDLKQGRPIPDNTVAITFDDGYISNYNLAFPVLEQYQLPATIFVVGSYCETGGGGGYKAMTWAELQTMATTGLIDIESHTYALHRLAPADRGGKKEPAVLRQNQPEVNESPAAHYDRIAADMKMSSQLIKDHLGYQPTVICWPYGLYDDQALQAAADTGYLAAIDLEGYINPKTDVYHINRMIVPGGASMAEFQTIVHPQKINYFKAMKLEFVRDTHIIKAKISRKLPANASLTAP